MKRFNYLLIPVLLLAACGPAPTGETVSGCHALMDGLVALKSGMKIPQYFLADNPTKQGGEFDVNQYFGILNHLSMQPGYSLDYVYHYDGMGGYPVLYAYPTGQAPYATEADLDAAGKPASYLDFVQADDTPEGYFQFALLALMGSQFYLDWHANYNDSQLVCDKAAVMATVASTDHISGMPMPLKARVQARFLQDVEPRVTLGEQTVEVRIVRFTEWGGFFRRTYTLQRQFPHTILDVREENLVPYDCGVMF
jgi:hypothetical protein